MNVCGRIAAICMVVALLAACAAPPAGQASSAAQSDSSVASGAGQASAEAQASSAGSEKVTVTWWTGAGQDQQAALQQEFVDTFNAAHPTIVLEMTFPEELEQVMNTSVQAGEGPDILDFQGYGDVGEYVRAKRMVGLNDYAASFGWKDKLLPWAYDAGVVDGTLYSLPLHYETMSTVFYNKTLFEQHGWKPPTTRAELEKLCVAIKEAGLIPFSNGNSGNKFANQFWIGQVYSNVAGAGKVNAALNGKLAWDDPALVEAVTLFKDWVDRGWIGDGAENYFSYDWDTTHTLMAEGKSAMLLEGTWGFNSEPSYFKDSQSEWDWFVLPALKDGVETGFDLSVGRIIGISANSKHPDAAAEVLNWVYGDKQRAVKVSKIFGFGEWLAPLRWTRADFGDAADERVLRWVDAFGEQVGADGKIGYTIWTFWPPKSQEYISTDTDRVLTGELTPADFQAGLQTVFAPEAADGKVPPIPATNIPGGQ